MLFLFICWGLTTASTCLYHWYFDQCAATQEYHAADTGHDTPPRHSIQTWGRPVLVLSNDAGEYKVEQQEECKHQIFSYDICIVKLVYCSFLLDFYGSLRTV